MSFSLKSIRKDFQSKGVFHTQPDLAEYMMSLVDVDIYDVYDPTCGDGGLLQCFPDDLLKFGQEIDERQIAVAQDRIANFTGFCGDTLAEPAFMDRRFSCIIANPPFSVGWQPPSGLFKDERFAYAPALPPKSKADYAFLLHIIHLLSDNGIAVVLNFPGVLYRGNSEKILRRWFVEKNWIERVIQIPGKTFVDTTIATAVLVMKKNKATTDIEFLDRESGVSRVVSAEEVASNDFVLSVSRYVQIEEVQQAVDPVELQSKARAQMVARLKADLDLDKVICEIEGWSFHAYLDDLKRVVCSYYTTF